VDRALRKYELVPIAVNSGVSPLLHDRTEEGCARREAETLALLRFMGHYDIPIASVQPRNPDPNRPRDEVLRDSADTMRDMIDLVRGTGVTFAFECHARSIVETMDEVRALTALVPELGFAYDPTHFVMSGVPMDDTLPLGIRRL